MINKIIATAILLIVNAGIYSGVIFLLKRNKKFDDEDIPVFKKSLNIIMIVVTLGALGIIWGINLENIWTTVLSILAIIAVALFTIWSLLSNIVAGTMLFMSRPFKRKDWIEVHPEAIQGRVKEIGVLFVTLEDIDKNTYRIPNNLFFQRYIKVLKKKPVPVEEKPVPIDETKQEENQNNK